MLCRDLVKRLRGVVETYRTTVTEAGRGQCVVLVLAPGVQSRASAVGMLAILCALRRGLDCFGAEPNQSLATQIALAFTPEEDDGGVLRRLVAEQARLALCNVPEVEPFSALLAHEAPLVNLMMQSVLGIRHSRVGVPVGRGAAKGQGGGGAASAAAGSMDKQEEGAESGEDDAEGEDEEEEEEEEEEGKRDVKLDPSTLRTLSCPVLVCFNPTSPLSGCEPRLFALCAW
jgi:hypothetical protein